MRRPGRRERTAVHRRGPARHDRIRRMPFNQTWVLYAVAAAVCASLINVLAKFGMKDVDKDFATAVRSVVQALFVVGFAAVVGVIKNFGQLHSKAVASIVLTGVCGGLSWIFAFRAIQIADV